MPRRNAYDHFELDAIENPFDTQMHPLEAVRIRNMPKFLARWEKLERVAKKLGVDVGYAEVGEEFEPAFADNPSGPLRRVAIVQVWGDAPRINGWEFLARIDNLDRTHATVSFAPGKEQLVDPALWQAGTNCDHCRVKRYRTLRYIVRCVDEESPDYGRIMVVGSTCLKDFLGHVSPENIAMIAGFFSDFSGLDVPPDEEERYGGGGSAAYYYSVKSLMPIVASLTTRLGFLSTKAAQEHPSMRSTADRLRYFLHCPSRDPRDVKEWDEFRKQMEPSEDDEALAAATIEWARNLEGTSSYELNIRAIASVENIGYKQFGMLASMVFAYMRATETLKKREPRAVRPEGKHLGTVGEKITLDLDLRKTIELEGFYGTSYLYLFTTPEGDDVVWKASKRAHFGVTDTGFDKPILEGSSYRVQAKVKEHGDYKGRPQTKIDRAKILAQL
jgi:hypothetical protein